MHFTTPPLATASQAQAAGYGDINASFTFLLFTVI
jgi:hypothetical protein